MSYFLGMLNTAAETVLLVEDTDSHALLIRRALKNSVTTILHAKSFTDAKTHVSNDKIQLIVTDLMLPDSQGVETVNGLMKLYPNLPVIVLTSSSDVTEAVTAMRAGAKDFIVKTFDQHFEELLKLSLTRVIAMSRLEIERARFEQETKALRAAIELGAEPVVILEGESKKILYHNAAYAVLAAKAQVACESIEDLFKTLPAKKQNFLEDISRTIDTLPLHAAWSSPYKTTLENFGSYDVSLSVVQERSDSEGGRKRLVVVWFRDVTEAEARERFQKDLIATTTHDLKNPLAAISLSTELLTKLVEGQEKAAKITLRIASSAQTALNLVDEFLSARRIDEGSFVLKPSQTDVVALIRESILSFEAIVKARSLKLNFDTPKEVLVWSVDPLGFQRVLSNLISNAAKFTKAGGEISVKLWNDSDRLHLEVKDSGSGMEPSEVGRLFERFNRLRQHANIPGTGLGLFIVKTIVSGHGGDISVTSAMNVGTTFYLTFPKNPPIDADGEIKIVTV